jgi:hypothetical protein
VVDFQERAVNMLHWLHSLLPHPPVGFIKHSTTSENSNDVARQNSKWPGYEVERSGTLFKAAASCINIFGSMIGITGALVAAGVWYWRFRFPLSSQERSDYWFILSGYIAIGIILISCVFKMI